MYFEKGTKKKNRKIVFSITLAIILLATSVAISTSVVTQKAFAADPVSSCFILYAIGNPAYFQAEQNFVNSLPNDQVLTKLSAQVGNGPIQNNVDLSNLLQNPNLTLGSGKEIKKEITNLIAAAGFPSLQQTELVSCMNEIYSPS
jgi:hypothetical protein